MRGNNGANVLNGGAGNDELTGRGGQDSFLFNTFIFDSFNVDVISDFDVADDTILLDDAIFSSSLGLRPIADGEFVIGAAALDANDRIIYDSGTGALYYDPDGNGAEGAIRFATLSTGLALTNLDLWWCDGPGHSHDRRCGAHSAPHSRMARPCSFDAAPQQHGYPDLPDECRMNETPGSYDQ